MEHFRPELEKAITALRQRVAAKYPHLDEYFESARCLTESDLRMYREIVQAGGALFAGQMLCSALVIDPSTVKPEDLVEFGQAFLELPLED